MTTPATPLPTPSTPPSTLSTPLSPAVMSRSPLTEQTNALRHSADLLTQAGVDGLSLTFDNDRITIQVGTELGHPHQRAAIVAHLAALAGSRPRRWGGTGPTSEWIIADGVWVGHRVHIFTALDTALDTMVEAAAGQDRS
ncbi:hypothetical protein [Microtetraspora sp. NBRC 16547]|uniref:hypothetical protein n=1 Tax=Microtetraspora sp. NBRC 16547 TaxID=3030993 RepID=UPI0024A52761|nr:hypothetical protein [Microtetraspora sp. NBRC 16547]GLW98939.1 hypothetical protein Misp02_30260 [Microtetraspora sp. NBRC 16547]